MSRIHEALKRAEEEKLAAAAAKPVPVQPFIDETLLDEPLMPEIQPLSVPAGTQVAVADFETPQRLELEIPQRVEHQDAQRTDFQVSPRLTWELIVSKCPQRPWKPAKGMLFLNGNGQDNVGTEEFRTLRSRLYHIREKRPLKTILVGSALPAEGKTFVSANLAQTLARQHGRRVVLLDCDLRRSRLHESFGTTGEPGVSDYLRGDADEFSILQRGPMDNLAFIPGGRSNSNPAELIANGRLEQLIHRLSEAFEWVVIDSPPAVPVSDASLIARHCDGILLVIQAAKTPYDLAQRARHEFRNMPVLGVVLNRVEAGSTYVSYYYGAYGKPGEKAEG